MKLKKHRLDIMAICLCSALFGCLLSIRYLPLQRCELHGELLKRGRAEIIPEGKRAPERGKVSKFPHSNRFVRYGFVDPPLLPIAWVQYCQRCRNAEDAWGRTDTYSKGHLFFVARRTHATSKNCNGNRSHSSI